MATKALGQMAGQFIPAMLGGVVQGLRNSAQRGRNRRAARRAPRAAAGPRMANGDFRTYGRNRRSRAVFNNNRSRFPRTGVTAPNVNGAVRATRGVGGPTRIRGTDLMVTVTKAAPSSVFAADSAPLVSKIPFSMCDELSWPRLNMQASQYNYGRFENVQLNYQPTCGTGTKGTLYVGVIADPNQRDSVQTYQDILALPVHCTGPVWQPQVMTVTANALNTQVPKFSIKDSQSADYQSFSQNQGWICWALGDTDNVALATYGTFSASYLATVSNSRFNASPATSGYVSRFSAYRRPAVGIFADLIPDIAYENPPIVWNDDYTSFRINSRRPFMIDILTKDTAATPGVFHVQVGAETILPSESFGNDGTSLVACHRWMMPALPETDIQIHGVSGNCDNIVFTITSIRDDLVDAIAS